MIKEMYIPVTGVGQILNDVNRAFGCWRRPVICGDVLECKQKRLQTNRAEMGQGRGDIGEGGKQWEWPQKR
jgi:hypothetical protein